MTAGALHGTRPGGRHHGHQRRRLHRRPLVLAATFNTANVYVNVMDLLPGPVGQPMAQGKTLVIRVDAP